MPVTAASSLLVKSQQKSHRNPKRFDAETHHFSAPKGPRFDLRLAILCALVDPLRAAMDDAGRQLTDLLRFGGNPSAQLFDYSSV